MTHAKATALLLATLMLPAAAHGQLFRAYLASTGDDAAACTLSQPCRLLPRALEVVADGGEVWMLDSANYNVATVDIAKSVTILAIPGVVGSVVGGAIALAIATPGVEVALRNLVIVPMPGSGGNTGVYMTAGASLTVDNCLIANWPSAALYVTAPVVVRIWDTTTRGNGTGLFMSNGGSATITRAVFYNAAANVHVVGGASATAVDIADSTFGAAAGGILASTSVAGTAARVSVRDSRIVGHPGEGMRAEASAGTVQLHASNNIISNNQYGIVALHAGSKVLATGNTVSGNSRGFENGRAFGSLPGGLFESTGDNALRRNSISDTYGVITVVGTN